MTNQLTLTGNPIQPKPVVKAYRHQYKRVAWAPFTYQDAGNAGTGFNATIQLPPGAVPLAGALVVTTAFNSTGSSTVEVGTSASAGGNLAATTLKTAGATALTTLPSYSTSAQTFGVTFAAIGGETAGDGGVYIEYILAFGQDFSVGDDGQATI